MHTLDPAIVQTKAGNNGGMGQRRARNLWSPEFEVKQNRPDAREGFENVGGIAIGGIVIGKIRRAPWTI